MEQEKMEGMELEGPSPPVGPQLQIMERVGSLPIVMSAVEQLGALYGYTKESNSLVKYGLETAESGLKMTSAFASPMVQKLETPVSKLDTFAVSQLEKLEQRLPILTKPTPQVLAEAQQLYNCTLRPTVDRLTSVTKYGVDSVSSVKEKGTSAAQDVREFTVTGANGVKYRVIQRIDSIAHTCNGVTTYGRDTLRRIAEENMKHAKRATEFGESKLYQLLNTHYGRLVNQKVDNALTFTDAYVDHYLPGMQGQPQVQAGVEPWQQEGRARAPREILSKAHLVSKKASQRIYSHGKAQFDKIIVRSAEAVNQLKFTVDLMEYAKTHLDSGKKALQTGLVKSRDSVWSVWEQISEDPPSDTPSTVQKTSTESRLISTARHLTSKIKRTFDSLPSVTQYMPETFRTNLSSVREKVDKLYSSFAQVNSLSEVQPATLSYARSLIVTIQTLSSSMLSYSAPFLPFTNRTKSNPNLGIEMEPNLDEKLCNEKLDAIPEEPSVSYSPLKSGRPSESEAESANGSPTGSSFGPSTPDRSVAEADMADSPEIPASQQNGSSMKQPDNQSFE